MQKRMNSAVPPARDYTLVAWPFKQAGDQRKRPPLRAASSLVLSEFGLILRRGQGHPTGRPCPPQKEYYGTRTGQVEPLHPIRPWMVGVMGVLAAMESATTLSMKSRLTARAEKSG